MVQAIRVQVDLQSIRAVQDAIATLKYGVVNRAMKAGATKGARRTIPAAKSRLKAHRRTGQLEKSLSVKYKGFPNAWVVLLGPRHGFLGNSTAWMSPSATRVNPVKYAHLLEGGRQRVEPKTAAAMPIFVRKLDPLRRSRAAKGTPAGKIPFRSALKFAGGTFTTKSTGRARKVRGGWLLFSMYARQAKPYPWLKPADTTFAANIRDGVESEVKAIL